MNKDKLILVGGVAGGFCTGAIVGGIIATKMTIKAAEEALEEVFNEIQESCKAKKVSYRRYAEERSQQVEEICFGTLSDARCVIKNMKKTIQLYGSISIGDYYELCGVESRYSTQKYGWTDVSDFKIRKISEKGILGRDHYVIEHSKPVLLKLEL